MKLVLRVAVPCPLDRLLDYLPPPSVTAADLQVGQRIEVTFGTGRKIGVLVEKATTTSIPPERLKQALAVLDAEPLLGSADLALLRWASRYYHHPIGEVMASAFAGSLRRGRMPVARRRLRLTAPVPAMAESLRRAPRQAELLRRLAERPAGLASVDLVQGGRDDRPVAAALIRKGWAQWQDEVREEPAAVEAAAIAAGPRLDVYQEAASTAILDSLSRFRTFLLDGVTGSGKTEVYLRAASAVLQQGRQVMILLPEISLTPQLEARLRQRFGARAVVVYHSGLNDSERHDAWLAAQRGEARILVGTRSAVFIPLPALGLIVLDEEHDASFKQQEGFRFSARDVAVMRARLAEIPIVLGSATPSLESLLNAKRGRYQRLSLPLRAGSAQPPVLKVLDIRGQPLREGISAALAAKVRETLGRGEQVLLFVNRRGYAPTLICHVCGWVAGCENCDANLVIHRDSERLRCHHCGFERTLPSQCLACGEADLMPLGLGTERIDGALAELFPAFRRVRIDRDSVRGKERLQWLLAEVENGRVDLLVGTQMLAKGHHFPGVTLVGIIDVDAGLFSTDFRAAERTAQLITQVAGRAGRAERPGTVILQTRHPQHPLLQSLVRYGYGAFAEVSLEERAALGLPPFSYQALWRAESISPEVPGRFLTELRRAGMSLAMVDLKIFGPAPAPLPRRAGRHRWQLLLQSTRRRTLHSAIDRLSTELANLDGYRRVRWSIDVDPIDLY